MSQVRNAIRVPSLALATA